VTSRPTNYFELLGVPQRFDIDVAEVESKYRELSRVVHPDRHVGSAASQRVSALQKTMDLNRAVKVLVEPGSRAEHLLSLGGLVIGDNERIDPELIMDVLEAREELAVVLAGGDEGKLEALEESMLDRRDEIYTQIARLFESLPDTAQLNELEPVKRQLILLRYVNRYLEQFDQDTDRDGRAA